MKVFQTQTRVGQIQDYGQETNGAYWYSYGKKCLCWPCGLVNQASRCAPWGLTVLMIVYCCYAAAIVLGVGPCLWTVPVDSTNLSQDDFACNAEGVRNTSLDWASDMFVAFLSALLAGHAWLNVNVQYNLRSTTTAALLFWAITAGVSACQKLYFSNSGFDDGYGLLEYYYLTIAMAVTGSITIILVYQPAWRSWMLIHVDSRGKKTIRCCGLLPLRLWSVLAVGGGAMIMIAGCGWTIFEDTNVLVFDGDSSIVVDDGFPRDKNALTMSIILLKYGRIIWITTTIIFMMVVSTIFIYHAKQPLKGSGIGRLRFTSSRSLASRSSVGTSVFDGSVNGRRGKVVQNDVEAPARIRVRDSGETIEVTQAEFYRSDEDYDDNDSRIISATPSMVSERSDRSGRLPDRLPQPLPKDFHQRGVFGLSTIWAALLLFIAQLSTGILYLGLFIVEEFVDDSQRQDADTQILQAGFKGFFASVTVFLLHNCIVSLFPRYIWEDNVDTDWESQSGWGSEDASERSGFSSAASNSRRSRTRSHGSEGKTMSRNRTRSFDSSARGDLSRAQTRSFDASTIYSVPTDDLQSVQPSFSMYTADATVHQVQSMPSMDDDDEDGQSRSHGISSQPKKTNAFLFLMLHNVKMPRTGNSNLSSESAGSTESQQNNGDSRTGKVKLVKYSKSDKGSTQEKVAPAIKKSSVNQGKKATSGINTTRGEEQSPNAKNPSSLYDSRDNSIAHNGAHTKFYTPGYSPVVSTTKNKNRKIRGMNNIEVSIQQSSQEVGKPTDGKSEKKKGAGLFSAFLVRRKGSKKKTNNPTSGRRVKKKTIVRIVEGDHVNQNVMLAGEKGNPYFKNEKELNRVRRIVTNLADSVDDASLSMASSSVSVTENQDVPGMSSTKLLEGEVENRQVVGTIDENADEGPNEVDEYESATFGLCRQSSSHSSAVLMKRASSLKLPNKSRSRLSSRRITWAESVEDHTRPFNADKVCKSNQKWDDDFERSNPSVLAKMESCLGDDLDRFMLKTSDIILVRQCDQSNACDMIEAIMGTDNQIDTLASDTMSDNSSSLAVVPVQSKQGTFAKIASNLIPRFGRRQQSTPEQNQEPFDDPDGSDLQMVLSELSTDIPQIASAQNMMKEIYNDPCPGVEVVPIKKSVLVQGFELNSIGMERLTNTCVVIGSNLNTDISSSCRHAVDISSSCRHVGARLVDGCDDFLDGPRPTHSKAIRQSRDEQVRKASRVESQDSSRSCSMDSVEWSNSNDPIRQARSHENNEVQAALSFKSETTDKEMKDEEISKSSSTKKPPVDKYQIDSLVTQQGIVSTPSLQLDSPTKTDHSRPLSSNASSKKSTSSMSAESSLSLSEPREGWPIEEVTVEGDIDGDHPSTASRSSLRFQDDEIGSMIDDDPILNERSNTFNVAGSAPYSMQRTPSLQNLPNIKNMVEFWNQNKSKTNAVCTRDGESPK